MKIGIDARKLSQDKSGIGYYTYHLLKEVLKKDRANHYILYSNKPIQAQFPEGSYEVKLIEFPVFNHRFEKLISPIWVNTVLHRHLRKDHIDIFFSPNFFKPIFFRKKSIITVHDLTFVKVPEAFPMMQRIYNKLFLRLSVNRAVQVLTVSNHSRSDIIQYLNVPQDQVSITYCAVDTNKFKPLEHLDLAYNNHVRQKYSLPDKYMLFVGTVEPRKNVDAIIRALALLKRKSKLDMKLFICGANRQPHLKQLIDSLQVADDVQFSGYVEDGDLPYIYANALMFVYPSIYEGFGMPPLEAMAAKVPTVTSNCSSLPEVVGDAALRIEPHDFEQLSHAMELLADSHELREELTVKGMRQIEKFSWERSADTFLMALND